MDLNLNKIKLIASAVRAGGEYARRRESVNPFEGRDETLRKAFHLGWSMEQEMSSDQLYPVEAMLRIVDAGSAFATPEIERVA